MNSDQSIQEEITFAVKDGPPSETVLRALTEAHEADYAEMEPLYENIDLDALDDLFRGPRQGTVTFEYGEYTVIVRGDVEVSLRK